MEHGITGASIIITANNHNPMIVSKDWLKSKGIIEEDPQDFNHTPGMSVFISENYQLIVDQLQFKLSLRVINDSNISALPHIVKRYVNALPETPYSSLAIDLKWTGFYNKQEIAHEILKSKFLKENVIQDHFKIIGKKTLIGCVVYKFEDNYRVRINIEPKIDSNDIIIFFYFLFEVKSLSDIITNLDQFDEYYKSSQEIVYNILE